MGDSSDKDRVDKRTGPRDRRDDSDDRRGKGRVETEQVSRRKDKDRRKE